jgi:hypothetical protein
VRRIDKHSQIVKRSFCAFLQFGIGTKKESSRKQIKESKNRGLKSRGTGVALAKHKAKRAANSK